MRLPLRAHLQTAIVIPRKTLVKPQKVRDKVKNSLLSQGVGFF